MKHNLNNQTHKNQLPWPYPWRKRSKPFTTSPPKAVSAQPTHTETSVGKRGEGRIQRENATPGTPTGNWRLTAMEVWIWVTERFPFNSLMFRWVWYKTSMEQNTQCSSDESIQMCTILWLSCELRQALPLPVACTGLVWAGKRKIWFWCDFSNCFSPPPVKIT